MCNCSCNQCNSCSNWLANAINNLFPAANCGCNNGNNGNNGCLVNAINNLADSINDLGGNNGCGCGNNGGCNGYSAANQGCQSCGGYDVYYARQYALYGGGCSVCGY